MKSQKIGDNLKRKKTEENDEKEYETKDDVEYQSGKVNAFTENLQEQL